MPPLPVVILVTAIVAVALAILMAQARRRRHDEAVPRRRPHPRLTPGIAHTIMIKPAGTGRIDIDAIMTLG